MYSVSKNPGINGSKSTKDGTWKSSLQRGKLWVGVPFLQNNVQNNVHTAQVAVGEAAFQM